MTAFPDDRRDLTAMFAPLTRVLIAREEPVLSGLVEHPVRTQAALARAINADKSRIIGVLDDLQHRGLIKRQPDVADRRVNLLSLTPAGDRLRRSVESAIRERDPDLLGTLPVADRAVFLRSLQALYEQYRTP
jgi:DNA-binding MarR family transcriptional regulator